ncbi:MAG: hypothetical protein ABEJ56_00315 [Candidatus Nanohaloarchaea archaeon]
MVKIFNSKVTNYNQMGVNLRAETSAGKFYLLETVEHSLETWSRMLDSNTGTELPHADSLKELAEILDGNFSIDLEYNVELDEDSGVVSINSSEGEEYRIERGQNGETFLKYSRYPQEEPMKLEEPYDIFEVMRKIAEWEESGGVYESIEHRERGEAPEGIDPENYSNYEK